MFNFLLYMKYFGYLKLKILYWGLVLQQHNGTEIWVIILEVENSNWVIEIEVEKPVQTWFDEFI